MNIPSSTKLDSKISKIITQSDKTICITPDADFWSQICKIVNIMTNNNNNLKLIWYKGLQRIHYTGQRLFEIGFTSETCSCFTQNNPDNHFHAIWNGTPVHQFWKDLTSSLFVFQGSCIPLSPSLCLLGENNPYELEVNEHHAYDTHTHWKNL